MKNNIIVFTAVLTIISFSTVGFMSYNYPYGQECQLITSEVISKKKNPYPDFFYSLGPRFDSMDKDAVLNATSINDFFDKEEINSMVNLRSTSIILIENDQQSDIREYGNTVKLNPAQLKLLKESDYSTHFLFRVNFTKLNLTTGQLEEVHSSPHYTVVPKTQAKYSDGAEALIEYFEKNNKVNTLNLDENNLNFAKLYFTVSTNSQLINIELDRSSGNKKLDNAMIDLLKNTPGSWIPAKNAYGEIIEQRLTITFGLDGC
jgi:hypothetical protein